jgi:hypothetical protein
MVLDFGPFFKSTFKDQINPKRQTALPLIGDHRGWTSQDLGRVVNLAWPGRRRELEVPLGRSLEGAGAGPGRRRAAAIVIAAPGQCARAALGETPMFEVAAKGPALGEGRDHHKPRAQSALMLLRCERGLEGPGSGPEAELSGPDP